MIEVAEEKGIDVVCITDHNSIRGAIEAKKYGKKTEVDIVVGEEVSTKDGEVLALFIDERIPPGLSAEETIASIHSQGGLAIAPHPYSIYCPALGDLIKELDLDGIEVFNAYHRDGYTNRIGLINGGGIDKAMVGGSDSHFYKMIGNGYTIFKGENAEELRKSIENRETSFGGSNTPLKTCIEWTMEVTLKSGSMIMKSFFGDFTDDDPVHLKVNSMSLHGKMLSLLGLLIYMTPPIPLICGIIGDKIIKRAGEKELEKFLAKISLNVKGKEKLLSNRE